LPIVNAYGHPRTSAWVPADTPVSPSVRAALHSGRPVI
jgi:hypothetical protein